MPEHMTTMAPSPWHNLAAAKRIYDAAPMGGSMYDPQLDGYCAVGAVAAAWGITGQRAHRVQATLAEELPEMELLREVLADQPAVPGCPETVDEVAGPGFPFITGPAPRAKAWSVVVWVNDRQPRDGRGRVADPTRILQAFDDAMELAAERGLVSPQPVPQGVRRLLDDVGFEVKITWTTTITNGIANEIAKLQESAAKALNQLTQAFPLGGSTAASNPFAGLTDPPQGKFLTLAEAMKGAKTAPAPIFVPGKNQFANPNPATWTQSPTGLLTPSPDVPDYPPAEWMQTTAPESPPVLQAV